MDRCALFVDAGYLLADGAMAVHGTRNRDSVSWDYPGLVQFLNEVARDRTGLSLLRCYWYEAVAEEGHSPEQEGIADIPGIKFRAAKIRPGRREGVDSYVQRDLTTLARTGVLCDAVLISGDEDMAPVVADVQDMGVRVTVVNISVEGNWTISRSLRRECDDLIEIGAGHLRPHVTLLEANASAQENASKTTTSFANSHGGDGTDTPNRPVTPHTEAPVTSTGGLEAMFGGNGGQPNPQGSAMDQLRAMRRSLAQQRGGGDHLAGPGGDGVPHGAVDTNGFPTGGRMPGGGAHPGPSAPGSPHVPDGRVGYPATGGQPVMHGDDTGGFDPSGRPIPGPPTNGGRPPYRGGAGPPPHQAGTGPQQSFAPGTGPQQSFAPGTGSQQSFAPDPGHGPPPPPRDPKDVPPPQDPRFAGGNPGYGGAGDVNPTYGTSTANDTVHRGGAAPEHGVRPPAGPDHDGHFGAGGHQESRPGPAYPHQGRVSAHTVEEAVHVAHQEGNDFAESIAREAPALWVEAVLARRPRMPSDLEARLLQGSSLPVDHLLRDEVRDGLRQGFWRALERARP